MQKIIQFPNESSGRTGTSRSPLSQGPTTATESRTPNFGALQTRTEEPFVPAAHTEIDDLVAAYERDPQKRAALENARARLARTVHAGDETTIRTMRLRNGWSQAQFAQKLGTSQSRVVRIEQAKDNPTLETCRKLCGVLEIDLNTLDKAIRAQERIGTTTRRGAK